MRDKAIGTASVIAIVIIIVSVAAGGYYVSNNLMSGEGGKEKYDELKSGETLITENLVELSISEEKMKNTVENVDAFRSYYHDNFKNTFLARTLETGLESEFEESYSLTGSHYKVLFSFEWENELSSGYVPTGIIDEFQDESMQLTENARLAGLVKIENYWMIFEEDRDRRFRLHKEKNELYVKKSRPNISVSSDLRKFSTVEAADKSYEAFNERIKEGWENMDYDPGKKAKSSLQGENYKLGEETFVRYYENYMDGEPFFSIGFRERNVTVGVSITGDISNLPEKTLKLAKIVENRLED